MMTPYATALRWKGLLEETFGRAKEGPRSLARKPPLANVTIPALDEPNAKAAEAAGMTRSAFVRQAALSSAGGKVVDVARVRRSVDEAERQLSASREALG